MKLKTLILLCIWSSVILANGEIARYQDKILKDHWAKLRRTELCHSVFSNMESYYCNDASTQADYFDNVYWQFTQIFTVNDVFTQGIIDGRIKYFRVGDVWCFRDEAGRICCIGDMRWMRRFAKCLAEQERQQQFRAECAEIVKHKVLAAMTSIAQDAWAQVTLTYDDVTETFTPTENEVLEVLEWVEANKDHRVLNLAGCQSPACIDRLITILQERNDIEMLIVANCNLTPEIARRILAVISHHTRLYTIDVSGNDLLDNIVDEFQAIAERNRSANMLALLSTMTVYPFVTGERSLTGVFGTELADSNNSSSSGTENSVIDYNQELQSFFAMYFPHHDST